MPLNYSRGRRPSLPREPFDFVPDRMAKENNLNISWNAVSVRARWPVASRSNCSPRTAASAKVAKACACSRATATANARSTNGSHFPTAPSKTQETVPGSGVPGRRPRKRASDTSHAEARTTISTLATGVLSRSAELDLETARLKSSCSRSDTAPGLGRSIAPGAKRRGAFEGSYGMAVANGRNERSARPLLRM